MNEWLVVWKWWVGIIGWDKYECMYMTWIMNVFGFEQWIWKM